MIILEGPDGTGKTALAQKFNLPYFRFIRESNYEDYLKPITGLKLFDAVMDRSFLSEYAYAAVMGRKFKFTMKEWHNLILLTLTQNPVVVLCVHKPPQYKYSSSQYLPYDKWDECLHLYRHFLATHLIPYVEYDYAREVRPNVFATIEARYRNLVSWWIPMWRAGYGAIGSPNPKVLLVAERLGPNNMNNLPFETGPTGRMLTDMLATTGTPLGKFAVTNLVKSYRRDPRPPNQADFDLLYVELRHLKPEKVVFMGSVAKLGTKVAKDLGIECEYLPHLGYYHHKGLTDMSEYYAKWRAIMGMIPALSTLSLKRQQV